MYLQRCVKNLVDKSSVGHSHSSRTLDNIAHVEALVQDNRWCELYDMAMNFDLPKLVNRETVQEMVRY